MTSKERKDVRYLRRKAKRDKKVLDRSKYYDDLNKAFCFSKVIHYADKCCNGVRYKKSTQIFQLHMFTNIACTCHNIKNGTYKVGSTYFFKLNERGKVRDIHAPHIMDRLVHKVLSNEIIGPIYFPHMIYDNGASMKNKGFKFCIDRIKLKLQKWVKKHGLNGYVVTIDFKKFFENCSHEVIHKIHKKYISSDYIIKVIEDYLFISKGIALGVEMAQREACMYPNKLDHFLENNNCLVERYMDDTFFIVESRDKAFKILKDYCNICESLKIKINKNKTKIIPIRERFLFCKWYFQVNKKLKVTIIPHKSTIYRQRRKIKRMFHNKVSERDLKVTIISFCAYLGIGNSYKYIKKYINILKFLQYEDIVFFLTYHYNNDKIFL